MNQEQIDKLRAAGYTDDDIRDFAATQPKLGNAPTQTTDETLPEIDVTKPSTTMQQAEAAGVPTGARESSFISDVMTAAPVVLAENAGKVALGGLGAGALGAGAMYKRGKALELETEKLRQQGIQNRFDAKMAQQAANQAAKVTPVAPSPILDASGRPMTASAPVVPQGMAPAPKAPSITAQIRALAANKIMPMAGSLAKGSVGPGMAMYSGELGPKTPQVGRMRGMEINPLTGRPWTPDQIKQYEANPNTFDSQMAPPQMRR
jgi:hypothetical protein